MFSCRDRLASHHYSPLKIETNESGDFQTDFYQQDTVTFLSKILSMVVLAGFVVGIFVNIFIVLVNGTDWVKRNKMSPVDRLLTALALSRIVLLWVLLFNWYVTVFDSALYCLKAFQFVFLIVWGVSNHFSTWFTTCLSIFYLLRIANFSSPVFLYLKWRVRSVLLIILVGSVPLLVSQLIVAVTHEASISDYVGGVTWKTRYRDLLYFSDFALFIFTNCIPFIMSLVSFVLLIFSLGRHLHKMQLGGKDTLGPSTQIHIRALKTVISFLVAFAINITDMAVSLWSFDVKLSKALIVLCNAPGILYPSVHSFVLMWGNKKLKDAFLSFRWQLRCWLREGSNRLVVFCLHAMFYAPAEVFKMCTIK